MKLYVQEPGTDRLLPLAADQPENRLAVLAIAAVEFRSAIRRRQRAGDIGAADAIAILENLQAHLETLFIKQMVNDAVIDTALEMIDRSALRAYDALQLAVSCFPPSEPKSIRSSARTTDFWKRHRRNN